MYVLNVVPHFVFLTDRPVKKSTLNDLVSFQVVLKTCKCNYLIIHYVPRLVVYLIQ